MQIKPHEGAEYRKQDFRILLLGESIYELWDSVVFCDYVSTSVGNRPRQPPSDKQWEIAEGEFPGILREFRPHLVVVLGSRLWVRLQQSPFVVDKTAVDRARLKTPDYECFAFAVYHPSSGRFSPNRDHGNYLKLREDLQKQSMPAKLPA